MLVHGNRVLQAVRIDYVFVDDEGYAFNFDFLFLIGIFTFVEAHTELHVALSAAAHFGFSNAEHGVFVVFFHQQFLKLGDNFGCYRNFQHAFHPCATVGKGPPAIWRLPSIGIGIRRSGIPYA